MSEEYKQSAKAVALSYINPVKMFLASFVFPIIADYLNYKNTKLLFEENFLTFEHGAFTIKSKEIPYEDIKNVRSRQSLIGNWFNYGDVIIRMKEDSDTIIFSKVNNPEQLKKAIQKKFVKSQKVKLL